MSDQVPAVNDNSIVLEQQTLTSEKGVPYVVHIAKPKSEEGAEETQAWGFSNKKPFGINVNWPVGNRWVDTTPEVRTKTGITRYNLSEVNGDIYTYTLQFTNTETYNYYFSDETGDSYQCNTWLKNTHSVDYNSGKPTIIFIKGN